MKFVLRVNFSNAKYAFLSERDGEERFGVEYPLIDISNLLFTATDKLSCETDVHYQRNNKQIPKGSEVTPVSIWKNYYGEYLRCIYQGDIYDVKTSMIHVERL